MQFRVKHNEGRQFLGNHMFISKDLEINAQSC